MPNVTRYPDYKKPCDNFTVSGLTLEQDANACHYNVDVKNSVITIKQHLKAGGILNLKSYDGWRFDALYQEAFKLAYNAEAMQPRKIGA